ncbi:hypothetical protein T4D_14424 [Trichinella pseudospiralis]|uniref:Uncharacterized protein n=1 Tax=Trichinella pseudospiralis TaxID=6337 RepID=A0A0V1G678_TRIPS|nr:hypothetical protein T4D_14424 [Trichinella pseudospiralis]
MRSVKVDLVCLCNEPLPRAGLFISSARLLARPSLFVDGLVLAAAFPFLSASRFNDGIAITKQQQWQSKAQTNDGITRPPLSLSLIQLLLPPPLPYLISDLHVQFFIR